jgi:hypothetical protein
MAIARNPKRIRSATAKRRAEAFISGAGEGDGADQNKKPTMIRVDRSC